MPYIDKQSKECVQYTRMQSNPKIGNISIILSTLILRRH